MVPGDLKTVCSKKFQKYPVTPAIPCWTSHPTPRSIRKTPRLELVFGAKSCKGESILDSRITCLNATLSSCQNCPERKGRISCVQKVPSSSTLGVHNLAFKVSWCQGSNVYITRTPCWAPLVWFICPYNSIDTSRHSKMIFLNLPFTSLETNH